MKKITFSKEDTQAMTAQIRDYFADELEQEIGQIPAEMLLQFFSQEFGKYYYNQGLHDAQAVLMGKMDDFSDAIYGLEQPTALRR